MRRPITFPIAKGPCVAGAELRLTPKSGTIISNRGSLAMAGILSGFGDGFMLPLIVVSAYVSLLTDNLRTVGAVPALAFGLWSLGSLIAQWPLRTSTRRKPWAFAANLIRSGTVALMAWIAWREDTAAGDRLETLLIAFGVFAFFSGVTSSATTALVRTTTDQSDRRRLLSLRSIGAAIMGVVAGVITRQMFASSEASIDRSFAYLFIAAAAVMSAATFLILISRESVGTVPASPPSPGGTTAHARSMRTFRRYALFRAVLAATVAADAMLIAFAIDELQIGLEFLGYCTIAFCAAMAGGLILWRMLEQEVLSRSVLQIAALLKILPPLIALTVPYLQDSAYYQEHTSGNQVAHWMIVAAFAALGLAGASLAAGGFWFLTSVSTSMTPWFSTATTAVLAPVSLAGISGGWIAERWGFDRLFAAALAVALVALLASGLLPVTASRQPRTGAGVAGPARQFRPQRLISR